MRQTQRMASLIGKAGEHAVAAQLMIRGMGIYFPASDYGVDLIAENGCRIQVKSSHLATTEKMIAKRGETSYTFPLRRQKRIAVADSKCRMIDRPKLAEVCDVLACWGIDQNRFWLIPSAVADKSSCLILGRPQPRKFVGSMEDVRQMVKLGYTHQQIANHYGVARTSITIFLNRENFESQEADGTMIARQCENAWENIIDFKREDSVVAVQERAAQEET